MILYRSQLPGGDVDIDSKGTKGRETPVPFGHLPAGLPQDPATEQDDKVAFLGNGNELARQYEPAFRVIPANQCFKTTNAVIDARNDWLVMDDERSEERRVGKECRSRWSP